MDTTTLESPTPTLLTDTLSPQQSKFVFEYLKDGNATAAARRAGYKPDNADVVGPRLLTKPHVEAAIRAVQSVRESENTSNLYAFIENLISIALFDPLDIHQRGTNHMRPMEDIPHHTRMALNLRYWIDRKNPDAKPILTGVSTADRLRALAMLMKTHAPAKPTWADLRRDAHDEAARIADIEHQAQRARRRAAQIEAEQEARRQMDAETFNPDPLLVFATAKPDPNFPKANADRFVANYAKVCQQQGVELGSLPDGIYRLKDESVTTDGIPEVSSEVTPPSEIPTNPNQAAQHAPQPTASIPSSAQSTSAAVPVGNPNQQKIPTNPNQQKIPTNPNHPTRPTYKGRPADEVYLFTSSAKQPSQRSSQPPPTTPTR